MTEWNDDTTESIPLGADYQRMIRNQKYENPITDQQKCLNSALDRLLAHKSGSKLLIQRLLEICKILETNIPDIGKVENKHTSSMYRDILCITIPRICKKICSIQVRLHILSTQQCIYCSKSFWYCFCKLHSRERKRTGILQH